MDTWMEEEGKKMRGGKRRKQEVELE